MLRTNSKIVRERIQAYIIDNFTMPSDLGFEEVKDPTPDNFKEIAKAIYQVFKLEVYYPESWRMKHGMSEQNAFTDWCQGLPSILDVPYYYKTSAVNILGDILEETETERNRYTEERAEQLLTYLIYREIERAQ